MARLGVARLGKARQGKVILKEGKMENVKVVRLKKTIGERSIYTQNIVDRFKNTKAGEIVSYDELCQVIGMECRPNSIGYNYVYTAIGIVQKEYGINMDNVRNVGYKHRDKNEVGQESMGRYKDMLKSVNKRTQRRLNTLDENWEGLSEEAKTNAVMAKTLVAFNEHILKPKNIEKIKAPAASGRVIGFKQTMELFEK